MSLKEVGPVSGRVLDFEIEGQRKNCRPGVTWKKCECWYEKERCTLLFKVECQCKHNCCLVEVNLATLTCWG